MHCSVAVPCSIYQGMIYDVNQDDLGVKKEFLHGWLILMRLKDYKKLLSALSHTHKHTADSGRIKSRISTFHMIVLSLFTYINKDPSRYAGSILIWSVTSHFNAPPLP